MRYCKLLAFSLLLLFLSTDILAQQTQSEKAFTSALTCKDASGSGTAQSCTTQPSFTPVAGDSILYKTTTTNIASLSINVNSSGAIYVRKWEGLNGYSFLSAGDMVAGFWELITYDGTYWEVYTTANPGTFPSVSTTYGPISSYNDGVHSSSYSWLGNTAAPPLIPNTASIQGPKLSTFTAWGWTLPSLGPGAEVDSLATTPGDGWLLTNTTLSTSGAPTQYSPSLHLQGHVWNTSGTPADNSVDWITYVDPVTGGGPYSIFTWAAAINGGAYSTHLTLDSFGNLNTGASIYGGNFGLTSEFAINVAPTAASGFNTNGTVAANSNGTASFLVTVGTGTATNTGVITLPASAHGWNCFATNRTRADYIQQTSADSTTSVTLTNYGTTFAATNFTNSDSIQVSCFGH